MTDVVVVPSAAPVVVVVWAAAAAWAAASAAVSATRIARIESALLISSPEMQGVPKRSAT